MIALYALPAIGLARFVTGLVQAHPVGYLAILLVVTLLAILVRGWRKIRPRTMSGLRALRQVVAAGTSLAVAVRGLAVIEDDGVRDALSTASGSDGADTWTYGGDGDGYSNCATASLGTGSDGGSGGCGGGGCGGGDSGGSQ
jgi:hypothetical protein